MAAARREETSHLEKCLDLVRAGDEQARNELIRHSCRRLTQLTRQMLRGFPQVHRWEQTDDVLNSALLRLHRALAEVKPESASHFFRLAALQIRRELLDLAKHYQGAEGAGAHHHTNGRPADDAGGPLAGQSDPAGEPGDLEAWTNFHHLVEVLPDDERECFSLLWYEGLTQEEAAGVLGVTVRTVKRRWASARALLGHALQGELPR